MDITLPRTQLEWLEAQVAAGVYDRMDSDALYARLMMFPGSGAARPSRGRFARFGVVESYGVTYDYRRDVVTVLRILDSRRNFTRRLVRR